MSKNKMFITIIDAGSNKHIINVNTVSKISESTSNGTEITLTSIKGGNSIAIYLKTPIEETIKLFEEY